MTDPPLLDARPLSPQGRLELAALALSPLLVAEFEHVRGGRELFRSIMARLNARSPGPDDPEGCGSIRATCAKLTIGECREIATDLIALFWAVEAIEGP